ncbi:MAG TPA: site-specific integrase [Candidatus Angelobacter sp.]|nr:site-specific integrase [Candidatus Angelobacter sp.]
MAVRKAGDRWIVEFMQRGDRVFRRLPKLATKADAQQLESKLRRQIFDAVDLGKLPDPLLTKVIDEWLETKKGTKAEGQTSSHASAAKAAAVGANLSEVGAVSARLRGMDLSAGTRNRRLCILKAVAKYAYQKGYTQENLSPKIQLLPENNARHVYLSKAQVEALVAKADSKEAAAFMAIAAYTGLRQGEVLSLTPADVSPDGLIVRDSKIGQPRIVPYLGHPKHLKQIPFKSHKRTLYAAFEAARDALRLTGLRYHDLRHTTASLLINSGADLYTVGTILGHKSTQTTKRYAHLSVERQKDALKRAFPSKLHRGKKKKARRRRPK